MEPRAGDSLRQAPFSMPNDIVRLAVDALRKEPDVPAILFEDGVVVTRGEFLVAVERFTGFLREHIAHGDRVVVMLGNRAEVMVAWLSVAANGGILVSLNHTARAADVAHVLTDSGAVLAITDHDTAPVLSDAGEGAPQLKEILIVEGDEPFGLWAYSGARAVSLDEVDVDPRDPVSIYYTSGTTGLPKGCLLGHDYWLCFVERWLTTYGMTSDDRLLCCLQLFYGDPPWQFLASLHLGTPWVVMRRFSVSRFWEVVRRFDVTHLFSIASIPSLLFTAQPSEGDRDHRVRLAVHLGIPPHLHSDLVERWGFPWVEAYGLTESGLVVAVPLDEADAMIGSGAIGRQLPGVDVRLVSDTGEDNDSHGELLVRSHGMFQSYLGRPEETAIVLSDGWLSTGDLMSRDDDGNLYFVGRKKDVIRRSGENVAAQEVEVVLRSHPSVLEAAVVPVPDDLRGEEVMAYVQCREECAERGCAPESLAEYCRDRLALYKVPRYFECRAEPFSRTPSMRVKKTELPRVANGGPQAWDREKELGW